MESRNLFKLAGMALFLACGSMLILPCPTWAKSNAFLKLPGVPGLATDKSHKDWIIVESFSWGAPRSGMKPIGSGATGAVRGPGELKITKNVDSASPLLTQHATDGHSYGEVKIETWRPDGKPGYRVFVLENVRIVSRIIKRAGQPRPIKPGGQDLEEITLNFSDVHWQYTSETDTGKVAPGHAKFHRPAPR
jgi:type VI secretion system Hcp family effector